MASATLLNHKLRSSLTILGLVIGNAAVIATIAVGQGAQNYTQKQLEGLGQNILSVFPNTSDLSDSVKSKPTLVLDDAEAIKTQLPAVAKVAPIVLYKLTTNYHEKATQTVVIGTTSDVLLVRNVAVRSGRFFSALEQQQNAKVVAIGSVIAQKLFGEENPIGQTLQINQISFEVIGVMQSKGSLMGQNQDDVAYVPVTTMALQVVGRYSPYGIPLDYMEIAANDSQGIRAAAFQLNNLLNRRHGKKDFDVQAQKAFLELTDNISQGLSLMLAAIASISLLVGGIGVMNIMLVSVTERTQEIGLRKAVGATPGDILTQFLIEAIMLCLIGGGVGAGVGIGSVFIINALTPLKTGFSLGAICISVFVSGSIGVFFGVIPASQAAKLDPVNALNRA